MAETTEAGQGETLEQMMKRHQESLNDITRVKDEVREGVQTPLDGNPKTVFGLRKPSMSVVPPVALMHLMLAMGDGAKKYGKLNWRLNAVTASVYYDAAMRHLMAWYDGEDTAPDSGIHHLGHAMACLAILVDAEAVAKLNDDRPGGGHFGRLLAQHTVAA